MVACKLECVSILFCKVHGFDEMLQSKARPADEVIATLDELYRRFDDLTQEGAGSSTTRRTSCLSCCGSSRTRRTRTTRI